MPFFRRLMIMLALCMIILFSFSAAAQTTGGTSPRPGDATPRPADPMPTAPTFNPTPTLQANAQRRSSIPMQTRTFLEGFLTVDVPTGWLVDANIYLDLDVPAPAIQIASPNLQTVIVYGLNDWVAYVTPSSDYRAGSTATLTIGGQQQRLTVRAPRDAESFFLDYVPGNILTFDDCRDDVRINTTPTEPRVLPGSGSIPEHRIEGVLVQYVCDSAGGYNWAEVYGELYFQAPGNYVPLWGIWRVVLILTNGDPDEAFNITLDIINSMRLDSAIGRRLLGQQSGGAPRSN